VGTGGTHNGGNSEGKEGEKTSLSEVKEPTFKKGWNNNIEE